MKRVNLRVIKSGDFAGEVLIKDRGEDGMDVLDSSGLVKKMDVIFSSRWDGDNYSSKTSNFTCTDGNTGLDFATLPFYCLTAREENELLLGRAITQLYNAECHLNQLLDDHQKAIDNNNFKASTESGRLEQLIEMAENRVNNLRAKRDRMELAALDAAEADWAKGDNQNRGKIPADFGKH